MLSNRELEDVGMVVPATVANLECHPSTWVFVHLSDSK